LCHWHICAKIPRHKYAGQEKGKVVEDSIFSRFANSADISAAASSNGYTARLLECASAVEAVVKETGDPVAAKQLNYLAWVLCKRSGGKVCDSHCVVQGTCTHLQKSI
jgi:hypothetical protein